MTDKEDAMVCAKDIMATEVITVTEDATMKHVIQLLVTRGITGLPVVSDDMELLGVVTEKDVLKALYNRDVQVNSVADLMTGDIVSFDENDDLIKVFKGLVENNFRRVPILSQGKLVGIISRTDIIKFLSKSAAKPAKTESED
jgi:CBS domain-containing protein